MTIIQTQYTPGRYGLGTEFAESTIPIEYSSKFTNRFININGDAEKRQGIDQLGDTISGEPIITGLHEYIDNAGNATILASSSGVIYKLDESTGAWTQVLSGKEDLRLISAQMNDKHIFVNGTDRNFYTDDAGDTFSNLEALIIRGRTSTSATSTTSLTDSNVENWLTDTQITVNDLVYNSSVDGYGIITSVGASNLSHTTIGTGGTGLGNAGSNQASGQFYRVIDLVELNIIEQNQGLDNFATATSGTNTTKISVSGVDFSTTDIRVGDYVYNTTRSAVSEVTSVSANINVTSITGQVANDSIQFFKSAMPISDWVHVHYGRAYYIDGREPSRVVITGLGDPQDLTTFQGTLDTTSIKYGSRQPQAERLLSLKTFQKYLIAGGERNVYIDSGTDPIIESTGAATNFSPVGLFPQGSVSRFAIESIGGTMNFAANDGIRNFVATFDNQSFQTANTSEAIKSEIAAAIKGKITDPDEIQLIHYPRRNWLMCKVGDVIYNYNYTPYYIAGQVKSSNYGSWSKFTGKFAEQKVYLLRRNGDLICGGVGGKVYKFDDGSYSDDGDTIQTIYETGWLSLLETQQSTQVKSGVYIKPRFEASQPVTYTITATGDYKELTTDSITAVTGGVGQIGFAVIGSSPIGGNRIYENKLPLRWKGEQVKIRIETNDSSGPDILTGFTIYGNILGKQ